MNYLVICLAAFLTSGLTLFSGFGLGTLLLPVMAIFFPLGIAIALTAVVHFFNNLFKLVLLGKHADRTAILRFGLPALMAAFLGAWTLLWLSDLRPLISYQIWGRELQIMPVKLVVACLMVFFALCEFLPRLENISFEKKYLPLGGVVSGFFGGLSGHQGALRSAFLIRYGLAKESFIATGVVISCLVDTSRIYVYLVNLPWGNMSKEGPVLLAAIGSACAGSFLGNLLVQRVTLRLIQFLVSFMIFGIALGLGMGII